MYETSEKSAFLFYWCKLRCTFCIPNKSKEKTLENRGAFRQFMHCPTVDKELCRFSFSSGVIECRWCFTVQRGAEGGGGFRRGVGGEDSRDYSTGI